MIKVFGALCAVGALGCWWFVVRYMILYRPFETEFGKHLIALTGALGALLTWLAIVSFWPTVPGREVVRCVLAALLAAPIWWRVAILEVTVWREDRPRHRKGRRYVRPVRD